MTTVQDFDKVAKFAKSVWRTELEREDPSVRGWNYGKENFTDRTLTFSVDNKPAFQIPLANVSTCTAGKNEAVVEFHQNDDCAVGLMEMRFHVAPEQADDNTDDRISVSCIMKLPESQHRSSSTTC